MRLLSINRSIKTLFAVFCFLSFSCDDSDTIDDPIDDTEEPVIYVLHGKDAQGSVSSFKPSDKTLTFRYALPARPHLNVQIGDDIYIHSYPTLNFENHLQIVSTPDIAVKKQEHYSEYITWSEQSSMTFTEDLLVIADHVVHPFQPFIRIIDKNSLVEQDTVNINIGGGFVFIKDLVAVNNQLFVSIGNKIKVYSLSSFKEVGTIPITGPPAYVTLDREGDILVYNASVFKLDPEGPLNLTKINNGAYNHVRPAYDPDDNTLYNFFAYAQPAPVAFGLRKMNLSTGINEDIIKGFDKVLAFDIKFVKFHPESQLIMIGGKDYSSGAGVLKTFTKDGKLKQEYTLNTPVIDVF